MTIRWNKDAALAYMIERATERSTWLGGVLCLSTAVGHAFSDKWRDLIVYVGLAMSAVLHAATRDAPPNPPPDK